MKFSEWCELLDCAFFLMWNFFVAMLTGNDEPMHATLRRIEAIHAGIARRKAAEETPE